MRGAIGAEIGTYFGAGKDFLAGLTGRREVFFKALLIFLGTGFNPAMSLIVLVAFRFL